MATIELEPDFTGPARSGQGGIAAGLLGMRLDGSARVRLHRPPPLARPMAVLETLDGLEARDGDAVVLSAAPGEVASRPPRVSIEQAAATHMDLEHHFAPRCIVCGPEHPRSLRVFPGVIEDLRARAAVWRPPAWVGDGTGEVRPELVWGVLDCPGSIAAGDLAPPQMFPALGTFTVALHRPVPVGEDLVVVGWAARADGRKLHAASAILDAHGEPLATAEHVCIAMPLTWSV